ncbi:MAG: hypothetical protein P1U74_06090 [Legionellaceae bacterium]|nr:hypothetical protein [Legionellaceae bacterium]
MFLNGMKFDKAMIQKADIEKTSFNYMRARWNVAYTLPDIKNSRLGIAFLYPAAHILKLIVNAIILAGALLNRLFSVVGGKKDKDEANLILKSVGLALIYNAFNIVLSFVSAISRLAVSFKTQGDELATNNNNKDDFVHDSAQDILHLSEENGSLMRNLGLS